MDATVSTALSCIILHSAVCGGVVASSGLGYHQEGRLTQLAVSNAVELNVFDAARRSQFELSNVVELNVVYNHPDSVRFPPDGALRTRSRGRPVAQRYNNTVVEMP